MSQTEALVSPGQDFVSNFSSRSQLSKVARQSVRSLCRKGEKLWKHFMCLEVLELLLTSPDGTLICLAFLLCECHSEQTFMH
jgi:hypothetical protein